MSAQDELTATACLAVRRLTPIKKAQFLLNATLALIEDRKYGDEVETYLGVCLETPGLRKEDVKNTLLAQRKARELVGGRLQLGPLDGQVRSKLPCKEIRFSIDPACQRIPPEIWDQIAAQTPRYHLRKCLFVSPLHREIASCHLFHTLYIKFVEFGDLYRGLDILDRAINNPVFASWVKSLRLRLEYDEGDTSDVIFRMLDISLRAFKAFRGFEWIGDLEMPEEMLRILTHKRLHGLGLIGWHFYADTISTFHGLRKFGSHRDEECEWDSEDVRSVLDLNESTLKHLVLKKFQDSLDSVFVCNHQ